MVMQNGVAQEVRWVAGTSESRVKQYASVRSGCPESIGRDNNQNLKSELRIHRMNRFRWP
jgi:hypothetical protein